MRPAICLLMHTLPLVACSPVASVGKRVDAGGDIRVDRLQVYSLVPMQMIGAERLHRDASDLDDVLGERLRTEKIDAVVEDVEALIRRHSLSVGISVVEVDGRRHIDGALPEREILVANAHVEAQRKTSHRLVLYPLRVAISQGSGVTTGIIRWQLEPVDGSKPAAIGLLRYTADVRGFPARVLAAKLVAQLKSLGVRTGGQ